MRYLYLVICILILLVTVNGCLTYAKVHYKIHFSDDFSQGTIKVIFENLRSTEEPEEKRRSDFADLLEMLEGDDFLLDTMEEGIYIKDRKLFTSLNMIVGEYNGVFRSLKLDDKTHQVGKNERMIILEKDDGDTIESNGTVVESEENFIITWPKEEKDLSITIIKGFKDKTYSMLDYYHEWSKN